MGAGPGTRSFPCLLTASPSTVSSVSPWWHSRKWLLNDVCGWRGSASFDRLHLADQPLILLQVRKLKLQLEEERQKCSRGDGTAAGDLAGLQNGSDLQFIEMQSKRSWSGIAVPGSGLVIHISQEELLQIVLSSGCPESSQGSNGAEQKLLLPCELQDNESTSLLGSGL